MYLSKHEQSLMKEELISEIKGMQQRGRFIFDYIPTYDRHGVGENFAVKLGIHDGDKQLMAVVWVPTATHFDPYEECFNKIQVYLVTEDGENWGLDAITFDKCTRLVDFLYEIADGTRFSFLCYQQKV